MNQFTLTSANEAEKIPPPFCDQNDVFFEAVNEALSEQIEEDYNLISSERDLLASQNMELQQRNYDLSLQNHELINCNHSFPLNHGSLIWMTIKINIFHYIGRFLIHGKLSGNNNNLHVAEEMILDEQGVYRHSSRFRNCELKDCYECREQVPNHNTIPILEKENSLNENGLFTTRGSEIIIENGRRCWFKRRNQLMEGVVHDSKLTNGRLIVSYDTGATTRSEIALKLSEIYMHPSLLVSPLFLHTIRNSRKK